MPFTPELAPTDPVQLSEWIDRQFRQLLEAMDQPNEASFLTLRTLNAEPDKPRNGMVVLADGTNWDPGSGAGYYGRYGGSWVKLG